MDFVIAWRELREYWKHNPQMQWHMDRAEDLQWNAYVSAHKGKPYIRTKEACQAWFGEKYYARLQRRDLQPHLSA